MLWYHQGGTVVFSLFLNLKVIKLLMNLILLGEFLGWYGWSCSCAVAFTIIWGKQIMQSMSLQSCISARCWYGLDSHFWGNARLYLELWSCVFESMYRKDVVKEIEDQQLWCQLSTIELWQLHANWTTTSCTTPASTIPKTTCWCEWSSHHQLEWKWTKCEHCYL